VGVGDPTHQQLPEWSSFAQGISWGAKSSENYPYPKSAANQLLEKVTEGYPEKVTLIALGSLKTFADWIRSNPAARNKIGKIVWFSERDVSNGFNYQASPESYEFIMKSGIRIDLVGDESGQFNLDASYLDTLQHADSQYAQQIVMVHSQPGAADRINQQHFRMCDDLVPLYLMFPMLFDSESADQVTYASLNSGLPSGFIDEIISKLLQSASASNNRVFNQFPVDSSLYRPAYAGILHPTIEKYGLNEWKAVCMTNEIHGHTGIYSIIGAKMGMRAMDYFNVGVNNMTVTTFAGNTPPLSCFNDGIQISTGSTIGQGLITISDSLSVIPSAIFEFNHDRVFISVRPEIAAQMQKDISFGVQNYGLQTEAYWNYIELLAIQYWSKFDRHDIFEMEPNH
jgi:pyrimidine-specific ribonucleoside hydrolase